MSGKFDKERDPYTFSLRGITAVASFVAPTAIEIDRMNRLRDERLAASVDADPASGATAERPNGRSLFGRFWLRAARRMS